MDIPEDDQIIAEVLEGSVDAFGLLVEKYQQPVYNLMRRVSGSPEQAEDLAQETFIRAYEKLDLFRPGKRFFPWLYTIGMNIARDFKRKNWRLRLTLDDTKSVRPNPGAIDGENRLERLSEMGTLIRALENLSEDYREAILLRFREGFTMKEIGGILGISTSGAKMRVYRGLKKLQDTIARPACER